MENHRVDLSLLKYIKGIEVMPTLLRHISVLLGYPTTIDWSYPIKIATTPVERTQ